MYRGALRRIGHTGPGPVRSSLGGRLSQSACRSLYMSPCRDGSTCRRRSRLLPIGLFYVPSNDVGQTTTFPQWWFNVRRGREGAGEGGVGFYHRGDTTDCPSVVCPPDRFAYPVLKVMVGAVMGDELVTFLVGVTRYVIRHGLTSPSQYSSHSQW